jgi:hypothetical protein
MQGFILGNHLHGNLENLPVKKTAQHSVPEVSRDNALDRWVRAAFFGIFVAWSLSRFDGDSRPTHQRVTHTVGRLSI